MVMMGLHGKGRISHRSGERERERYMYSVKSEIEIESEREEQIIFKISVFSSCSSCVA